MEHLCCPECGVAFPRPEIPVACDASHYIICAGCADVFILIGFGAGLTVHLTTDDEFDRFISNYGFRQMYLVACRVADAREEMCP